MNAMSSKPSLQYEIQILATPDPRSQDSKLAWELGSQRLGSDVYYGATKSCTMIGAGHTQVALPLEFTYFELVGIVPSIIMKPVGMG